MNLVRDEPTYLTDANGAVTDTYDYDAFGVLIHSAGIISTPGKQFDPDLNLYYNRALDRFAAETLEYYKGLGFTKGINLDALKNLASGAEKSAEWFFSEGGQTIINEAKQTLREADLQAIVGPGGKIESSISLLRKYLGERLSVQTIEITAKRIGVLGRDWAVDGEVLFFKGHAVVVDGVTVLVKLI